MNKGVPMAIKRWKCHSDQSPAKLLAPRQVGGKSTGKVKIFANHYSGVEPKLLKPSVIAVKHVSTTVNIDAITTTHRFSSDGTN